MGKVLPILISSRLLNKTIDYSYGYFCRNNPNATRIERRNAIKRFLDYIRDNLKIQNETLPTESSLNYKNTSEAGIRAKPSVAGTNSVLDEVLVDP